MVNFKQFEYHLPAKVKDLCHFLIKQGFRVGFIGGVIRGYLINSTISDDIDLEIRPFVRDDFEKWPLIYESIRNKYPGSELLPFNVLRVKIGEDTVELSLPRVEHFDGSKGHSNFKAEFIPDIDFTNGFFRRDLTINSIMFDYDGKDWTLVDPYNGIKDIQDKVIRHSTTHFSMDPVRFLRAMRFAIKLKFSLHPDTQDLLEKMSLKGLSEYYLKTEVIKSKRPLYMLKRMADLRSDAMSGLHLHSSNKDFVEYDKYFTGDLNYHLRQAIFLSLEVREYLLNLFGYSIKGLLSSLKINTSWKTLSMESSEKESFKLFFEVLSRLEKLEIKEDKLEYILNYYNIDFTLLDFQNFCKTKYTLTDLDLKEDKSKYSSIVFKKRLKQLL